MVQIYKIIKTDSRSIELIRNLKKYSKTWRSPALLKAIPEAPLAGGTINLSFDLTFYYLLHKLTYILGYRFIFQKFSTYFFST